MARKYHEIKGLAEFTAKMITSDEEQWKKFLHTAGHMYKYPFREQMLIYAQRPDATACASLELWNEKMNCWVNKGAQGIALIDEEGVHRSGLKYVFDVKDVHEARFIGRNPTLWKMEDEHKDYVIDSLERIYGETDASRSFESRIMELANRIASEMAPEIVSDQLAMSVEGSFLDGLDDLNLEVRLQQTMAASIAYTILERCGMDAEDVVGIEFPYLHRVHSERGLSDSEPDSEQGAGGDAHEIRTDEEELSEGTQKRSLQRDVKPVMIQFLPKGKYLTKKCILPKRFGRICNICLLKLWRSSVP